MAENDSPHGFSSEQVVIYKLGQIESLLDTLIAKQAEHALATTDMISGLTTRVKTLEDNFSSIRNKFVGGLAVISFVMVSAKVFIEKWLNL